jgi:hypothetical protein
MFLVKAIAQRFAGRLHSLYRLHPSRPACFSTSPIQLNSNNWKEDNRTKNGQISSLVVAAMGLKNIRKVDQAMLQRMDYFVSQPGNLAGLNPIQFCILLGYYSFCMHRNLDVISMMVDYLVNNPAFLQKFNSQEVSNSLNFFSKFNMDLRLLFTAVANVVVPNSALINGFSSQNIANTLNAFAKKGYTNETLFTLFGNRIINDPKFVKLFEPQHVSNILNAFAKMHVKNRMKNCLLCSES